MICIVPNFPFYSPDIKISFLQQQKRFQDLDLDKSKDRIFYVTISDMIANQSFILLIILLSKVYINIDADP